jgi:hypothetical protein
MRTKTAALLLGLFAAVQAGAETNQAPFCCRDPIRIFHQGAQANLTPLFKWWVEQGEGKNRAATAPASMEAGETNRPLWAWKRVTGVKAQETESGWVLDADVASSPATRTNEWIVLLHPPTTEAQEYDFLQSLSAQYEQRITNDARAQQAYLKAAQNAETRAAAARSWGMKTQWQSSSFVQLAARERNAAQAALNDEQQTQKALDQTRKQLAVMPSREGQYEVDCFALETGRNQQGLPIFDTGEVNTGSE